jgi:hypothetical protein
MGVMNFRKIQTVKKQTTKSIKNLCTPAFIYLAISTVSLLFMLVQNFGNTKTYCIGNYNCDVHNTISVFVIKVLYIAFWTWLLNFICSAGYTNFAWFMVLFPYILFAMFMLFLLIKLR